MNSIHETDDHRLGYCRVPLHQQMDRISRSNLFGYDHHVHPEWRAKSYLDGSQQGRMSMPKLSSSEQGRGGSSRQSRLQPMTTEEENEVRRRLSLPFGSLQSEEDGRKLRKSSMYPKLPGLKQTFHGSLVDSVPELVPYASVYKSMDASTCTSVHTRSTCAETKSLSDCSSSVNDFSRRSYSIADGSTNSMADMNTTNHSSSSQGTANPASIQTTRYNERSASSSNARYHDETNLYVRSKSGHEDQGRDRVRNHAFGDFARDERLHVVEAQRPLIGSSFCRQRLDDEDMDGELSSSISSRKQSPPHPHITVQDESLRLQDLHGLKRRVPDCLQPNQVPHDRYTRSTPSLVSSITPMSNPSSMGLRSSPIYENRGSSSSRFEPSGSNRQLCGGSCIDEANHDAYNRHVRMGSPQVDVMSLPTAGSGNENSRSGGSSPRSRSTYPMDTLSDRRRRYLDQYDREPSDGIRGNGFACRREDKRWQGCPDEVEGHGQDISCRTLPHPISSRGRDGGWLGVPLHRSPQHMQTQDSSERGFDGGGLVSCHLDTSMPALHSTRGRGMGCRLMTDESTETRPRLTSVGQHDNSGRRHTTRENGCSSSPAFFPSRAGGSLAGPLARTTTQIQVEENPMHPASVPPAPPLPPYQPRETTARPEGIQEVPVTFLEIGPGVRAALRTATETKAAIVNDYYVPKVCVSCFLDLFCIQDVEYFVCPVCKAVCPMEGEEGEAPEDNGSLPLQGSRTASGKRNNGVCLGFTIETLFVMQAEIMITESSS